MYKIIQKGTVGYVVRKPTNDRIRFGIRNPNYDGTHMALCGVLLPEETLEEWIERKAKTAKKYKTIRKKIDMKISNN